MGNSMNQQTEYQTERVTTWNVPLEVPELTDLVTRRLYGSVRGIRVQRSSTHLLIHGRTDSYYIKQLAQSILMEYADGMPVINKIRVF